MGLLGKLRTYRSIFARARRAPDTVRLLRRRPAIMAAVGVYELALLASGKVDERLNYRARFNRVFGVEAVGFSAGAFCALPEHGGAAPAPHV